MYTIHLHNLEFFAYHGVHEEETLLGNKFLASMDISTNLKDHIGSVDETIDYSVIYGIIHKHMRHARPLLEQVAAGIAEEVLACSNHITAVSINLKKMHAPIEKFKGEVGVSYTKSR